MTQTNKKPESNSYVTYRVVNLRLKAVMQAGDESGLRSLLVSSIFNDKRISAVKALDYYVTGGFKDENHENLITFRVCAIVKTQNLTQC